MGKHYLTRLLEAEKTAEQVIAKNFPESVVAFRALFRHPDWQAALQILLQRKFTISPGMMFMLLHHPLHVRFLSQLSGGTYPKVLRDRKKLRLLAARTRTLAFELEEIATYHDIFQDAGMKFFDRVNAYLRPGLTVDLEHISLPLRAVSRVLEEVAEKGPPVPALYSKLAPRGGKQPNPYIDNFVYHQTRAFRKAYRAPLYQVTAHLINSAMKLPDKKKYTGRRVFDIYRRMQKEVRRKRKLTLV